MSKNVDLAGALLQGATFSDEQLRSDAIDFTHAMGDVNVVDGQGLHLGQLDIAQVDAYRAGEIGLGAGRAEVMAREAGRASAVDSVCQSYREAGAVHFAKEDTLGAATEVVAGLSNAVVEAIGLETENPAIGPPGREEQQAAELAAFEEFTNVQVTAAELEAAGVPEAHNVAKVVVEEGIGRA